MKNDSSDYDFAEKDFEFVRRLTKTDPKDIEKKSIEMKKKIEGLVKKENQQSFFFNPFKTLGSKDKIRFQEEGFDLDLTYITERIIALAFPFDASFFGNSCEEVQRFFNVRHPEGYKIYNLCSEQKYDSETFHCQGYYATEDHEATVFENLIEFCQDASSFLAEDDKNVIAVHCKAGKGRTGLFLCCFLMYIGFASNARDAMRYFGLMRTAKGRSVKIPSQKRYIKYFETILKQKKVYEYFPPKLSLKKIKLFGIPNFSMFGGCTPYFKLTNGELTYSYKEHFELKSYKNEGVCEFADINVDLQGDSKIIFYNKTTVYKELMFKFWINTFFVPNSGVVRIEKTMLDAAFEDTNCSYFKPDFYIEITFTF